MKKPILKRNWRELDNTAKAFSMEDKRLANTFRLSVILKEKIDSKILKQAIKETLEMYPSYKVKMKSGFFWNYLKINNNDPILDDKLKFKAINFGKNNDYLFKVTCFNNKINLDICHILTDGIGATIFLKGILYNYLNLKYDLSTSSEDLVDAEHFGKDECVKNANKKLVFKEKKKKAFLIKNKSNFFKNKTYHYVIDLDNFRKICKKNNVSLTEYLSALYIYTIYKTIYDKSSDKDISLTIPIDLRRYYNVESFSNFFTCVDVKGNVKKDKYMNFNKILKQVKTEFREKLAKENIPKYLSRDVKLGSNIGINMVPLSIKKVFMKYFGKYFNQSTTTTLSNLGPIKIDEQYKKYIDNILVLVSAGKMQKVKCTICSYENNLTITINSNLVDDVFENEFYNLLKKHVGKVNLICNE